MIWFWVVVLVVIIGVAAVVAAGRGDAMADVYEDRPDVTLGRGHPLAAADVAKVRFTTAVRGYRMDEVDAFVARIEADLRARDGATTDETTTTATGADRADDRRSDDGRDAADQSLAQRSAQSSAQSSTQRPADIAATPTQTKAGRRRAQARFDVDQTGRRSVGGKRRADHGVDAAPEASTDGDDADTSR